MKIKFQKNPLLQTISTANAFELSRKLSVHQDTCCFAQYLKVAVSVYVFKHQPCPGRGKDCIHQQKSFQSACPEHRWQCRCSAERAEQQPRPPRPSCGTRSETPQI